MNYVNLKHGGRYTRLYDIWCGIKKRCFNLKSINYKYYGGRGITICNEWLEFIPFRDWSLSHGYQEGLEIDRRDNNLGYSPENCRWTTHQENMRKTRQCKINMEKANEIRYLHKTGNYTQKELAEKFVLDVSTICYIINNKIWV